MANVLFGRLGMNDTIIKNIELPREGDGVFLDGRSYTAASIKHFPEGGKGIEAYKKVTFPFTRILLIPSNN